MSKFASAGRVVVGIDGSVSAGTAAEWAARRAEALGVGLTMVAVGKTMPEEQKYMNPSTGIKI